MKAPYTGEKCSAMTRAMYDALSLIESCSPAPHVCPNYNTANALLDRRWIVMSKVDPGAKGRLVYFITDSGRSALRITRRMMERRTDGNTIHR